MLDIRMSFDTRQLARDLPDWAQNRLPSIVRNALNDAAEDAVSAEIDKIRGVFDRPTPFTERAVVFPWHLRATKDHLEATIMIRDESAATPPSRYLAPSVTGGARPPKPFEKRLRAMGVMRPDEFATTAIGYARNAYGNIPGPTYVAILSQLKAFAEVGFKMNETGRSRKRAGKARTRRYFVPAEGSGLRRGIYERVGNRMRAVLIFVRQPVYRRRFDFGQAAEAKVRRVLPAYFSRHFYSELGRYSAKHN